MNNMCIRHKNVIGSLPIKLLGFDYIIRISIKNNNNKMFVYVQYI